jgi:hypothetical protein
MEADAEGAGAVSANDTEARPRAEPKRPRSRLDRKRVLSRGMVWCVVW